MSTSFIWKTGCEAVDKDIVADLTGKLKDAQADLIKERITTEEQRRDMKRLLERIVVLERTVQLSQNYCPHKGEGK